MEDLSEIAAMLADGDVWKAASALARAEHPDYGDIAGALASRSGDAREILDIMDDLILPPPAGASVDAQAQLACTEAMRLLAVAVALRLVRTNWRDILGHIRLLAGSESTFRVQEASVELIATVASVAFDESTSFWQDILLEGEAAVAATTLAALAVCDASVPKILDLFEMVIGDARKAVRNCLATRAIPHLGRRDPDAVYIRLRQWISRGGEVARWNVAEALTTALGGAYVERAIEILEILAADERPMVWRAASKALVQVAQRRPAYVLPILGRWREDPKRWRCAEMALAALADR